MSEQENVDEIFGNAMNGGTGEAGGANGAAEAAEFGELSDARPSAVPSDLSMLYDLTVPVAIELGRTRISIEELLAVGRGSVIQLDRLAGEPIDVFVGDRRFAEGEVVVVGEQFAVRITRILKVPHIPIGEAHA